MTFAADSYSVRLKSIVILTFDICYVSQPLTPPKSVWYAFDIQYFQ